MNQYKFYCSPINEMQIQSIEGQTIEKYIGKPIVLLTLQFGRLNAESSFFEVVFDAQTRLLQRVNPINWHEIKPEVIKHINEVNEMAFRELEERGKEVEQTTLSRMELQEVIDRSTLYGQSFKDKLLELLEQFPIKVEYLDADSKESTSDIISYRKVSLPQ